MHGKAVGRPEPCRPTALVEAFLEQDRAERLRQQKARGSDLPLGLLLIPLAFLFRKHIGLPEFLRSGTAQAVITGVVLVLVQLGWLALLNEASTAMEGAYRALLAAKR